MKALLIPIKDPANSKTRLAAMLLPEERRRLAWAMFEDVGRAVSSSHEADRIVMVTSFAPAIERARQLDWDVLIEESQASESASVDWASSVLSERGFETVMRVPADLPLVQTEDVDALLSVELKSPSAVIVPSRDGTGTNAIIRTPPTLFPSRFGPDSFALHQEEARRVGVECIVVRNARIALDIDEPSDVEVLLENGKGTQTFAVLSQMNIFERLERKKVLEVRS